MWIRPDPIPNPQHCMILNIFVTATVFFLHRSITKHKAISFQENKGKVGLLFKHSNPTIIDKSEYKLIIDYQIVEEKNTAATGMQLNFCKTQKIGYKYYLNENLLISL
jgi:hypothetical protein